MKKYVAGIDVGSVTTKTVLLSANGEYTAANIQPTGVSSLATAKQVLNQALIEAGINTDCLHYVVSTGYSRDLISFAQAQVTEITCHARGAFEGIQDTFTLIDIGGQDSKVIAVDRLGNVKQFFMNDRCAAGTGRFLEVMARVLETDLENLSRIAAKSDKHVTINSMCTVFAETEVVSLIAQATPQEQIARGICYSVAERVVTLIKKIPSSSSPYICGGVAHNQAVNNALEDILMLPVMVIPNPQLNGAYGAALIARERYLAQFS
jgi:predicted CoA-substrate-specific enzyme activase